MKRLFLTLGLVIAFLISVNNANAALGSIFDTASYQSPKIESSFLGYCFNNNGSQGGPNFTPSSCHDFLSSQKNSSGACVRNFKQWPPSNGKILYTVEYNNLIDSSGGCVGAWLTRDAGDLRNLVSTSSSSCPPDEFPLYTVGTDNNNDGKDDQCYNPDELDNLSNCANEVGSMLPAITNISNKVCKTDPNSGARCGYSKKDGDIVYKTDLEMNCFGDGEKVPEYDPEPMPQPDKCAKYNDQLMVCKADPKEKCDALGNCGDQCGFVNKELFCFIECEGADCDKETPPPPVNCETNPTAPVCVEEPDPDPEFCKANPTDPKCATKPPEPCTGDDCPPDGGGGTGEKVDLKPVVDELKELNKKLDFKTTDKTGKTNFGGFSDLFSSSDIQAIKNMTDEKKQEITEQITTIKAEFKDMFEVTASGGAYTDITLNLSMGDFHPQFWSFIQANIGIIGAIVMALAYLMAIRIISE